MAYTKTQLKALIDEKVEPNNHTGKITGAGVNETLTAMVDAQDDSLWSIAANQLYTCSTAAATAAKTIAATGFTLKAGGSIKIKFEHANSASSPTLNIESTGAKAIYYNGSVASASNTWVDNEVVEFFYNNAGSGSWEGHTIDNPKVSVSQNSQTGGINISVGSSSFDIAKQDSIKDLRGIESALCLQCGNIDANGVPFSTPHRVRTSNIIAPFSITLNDGFRFGHGARYTRNSDGKLVFDSLIGASGSSYSVSNSNHYYYSFVIGKYADGDFDNNYDFSTEGYDDVVSQFDGVVIKLNQRISDNANWIGEYHANSVSMANQVWKTIFQQVNIKNGDRIAIKISSATAVWTRAIIGTNARRIKDWNPVSGQLYEISSGYDVDDLGLYMEMTTAGNVDIDLYLHHAEILGRLEVSAEKSETNQKLYDTSVHQTNVDMALKRNGSIYEYMPLRFESGHKYRITITADSGTTLSNVFTCTNQDSYYKVDDLPNLIFSQDGQSISLEYTPTGNARFFHYYTSHINGRINVIDLGVTHKIIPNHWKGKKIVWLGTSVPYGAMASTSYPLIAANNLGFQLVQTSVPGIMCHAYKDTETGLWYPGPNGSSCLTKAEYIAAKEAGLTTLEIPNSPIVPYVPGGANNLYYGCVDNIFSEANADADLWVFDVTPNCSNFADTDWDAFNKNSWSYNEGTFADHRGTFLGAILYMMDKMYELNPNARMVLMCGSGLNYAEGKADFEKMVAQWQIGLIDIQKKLNVSPRSIGKVYAWDVEQGTFHPSTFGQNILGNILTHELLQLA